MKDAANVLALLLYPGRRCQSLRRGLLASGDNSLGTRWLHAALQESDGPAQRGFMMDDAESSGKFPPLGERFETVAKEMNHWSTA